MRIVQYCLQTRQYHLGLSPGISYCQIPQQKRHIHISRKTKHEELNPNIQVGRKGEFLNPVAVVQSSADVPVPCDAQHMSGQLRLKG